MYHYNASVVKTYNTTHSLVRFFKTKQKYFLLHTKRLPLGAKFTHRVELKKRYLNVNLARRLRHGSVWLLPGDDFANLQLGRKLLRLFLERQNCVQKIRTKLFDNHRRAENILAEIFPQILFNVPSMNKKNKYIRVSWT
jgi:hypothetical protein